MISAVDLQKVLLKEIVGLDPDMPIIIRGVPPPEKKESWLQFAILDEIANPDPRTFNQSMVELMCFSVHANLRVDGKYDVPWSLAHKYRKFLHRAAYCINNTCVRSAEAKMVYIDNSTTGSYFQNAEVTSPLLNSHCVVISSTFTHFTEEQ